MEGGRGRGGGREGEGGGRGGVVEGTEGEGGGGGGGGTIFTIPFTAPSLPPLPQPHMSIIPVSHLSPMLRSESMNVWDRTEMLWAGFTVSGFLLLFVCLFCFVFFKSLLSEDFFHFSNFVPSFIRQVLLIIRIRKKKKTVKATSNLLKAITDFDFTSVLLLREHVCQV